MSVMVIGVWFLSRKQLYTKYSLLKIQGKLYIEIDMFKGIAYLKLA